MFMFMSVCGPEYVYNQHMRVCCSEGSKEGMLEPLELKLQMILSPLVGPGIHTSVFSKMRCS